MTRNEFLKLLAAGALGAGAPILLRAENKPNAAKHEPVKHEPPKRAPVVIGIIGDPGVGKTALAEVYVNNRFPDTSNPTRGVSNYARTGVKGAGGAAVDVVVREISCYEASRGIWPAHFPTLDAVVMVYSMVSPVTFESIKSIYAPALKGYKGGRIPIVLVGNKSDLGADPQVIKALAAKQLGVVSMQAGMQRAREIGAGAALECSALTKSGVQAVFERALAAVHA